jgi:hypothetical protein
MRRKTMLKIKQVFAAALCLVMFVSATTVASAAGVPGKGVYPENNDLPEFYGVPDLMTFNDGSLVTTQEDWLRRRPELLDAIQYYE